MLIKTKIFLRRFKTTAFWPKSTAKSRHLTKITVSVISVFPWLSTVPTQYHNKLTNHYKPPIEPTNTTHR